jgi:hypothetical protein
MLSGDRTNSPVDIGLGNLSKAKRWSDKANVLLLIGLWPNCPNGPLTHTNSLAYHVSIATILRALEDPATSGLAVLCADGCAGHVLPRIATFLADHTEQCTMTTVKNEWCPQCEICPDDMPCFTCRPRCRHPQRYLHLSTTAADEVGLCKLAECPNFTNAHAGCNIYGCLNVGQLHQLLKGVFKDHT